MIQTHKLSCHRATRDVPADLFTAGVIRLVTEIDDNGPIEHGMLGAALSDLAPGEISDAVNACGELQLVHGGDGAGRPYRLTRRGSELADVYEEMARWARAHDYPARTSTFITRVQTTLTVLAQRHGTNAALSADETASTELCVVAADLTRWIHEPRKPADDDAEWAA